MHNSRLPSPPLEEGWRARRASGVVRRPDVSELPRISYRPIAESRAVRVVADAWLVRGQRTNPWSHSVLGEILRADVVHCHQQHILMSSTAAAVSRVTGRRVFATPHVVGIDDVVVEQGRRVDELQRHREVRPAVLR